jgi:hypothetical protein
MLDLPVGVVSLAAMSWSLAVHRRQVTPDDDP